MIRACSIRTTDPRGSRIVEPGPSQAFGDPDRLWLPDQCHLERRRCGEAVGYPGKRQWSVVDERHHRPPEWIHSAAPSAGAHEIGPETLAHRPQVPAACRGPASCLERCDRRSGRTCSDPRISCVRRSTVMGDWRRYCGSAIIPLLEEFHFGDSRRGSRSPIRPCCSGEEPDHR